MEIGDAEEALRDARDVPDQDAPADGFAEPHGGEEGGGEHDGHHVLEPCVIQKPDVFEAVALLDEADRVLDAPNRAQLRWWDPDDGWKIGTLCRWCAEEALDRQPRPEDYAVATRATNGVCDDCDTDEDPTEALL